ncbi:protease synthase and sporulation negative regulatory protein PAI 1 [Desulfosporosinus acididurans]|uniref:Protease synthase and sporulation negative regulatory protein PAI 1 n=1 Tax=Desulfosporosinus acididurans TaxID=476652 RepID=A0A0J1FPS7_9FIRM|nr:GNAT family N-acetyltransferase [Desulfosporosinus acididurans]KLU65489.1 protease synthase and sporulation negative regulatory protein PAI 1 [Desulfosporosinus acididurans]
MIIKKYHSLNEPVMSRVLELENVCNDYDRLKGSVFLDTSLNFNQAIPGIFLLYDCQTLISMLSMFIPSHLEVEISAMTRPEYRQNGYFTALLEQAVEELRSHNIPEILFVCEKPSDVGKDVLLNHLQASYEHTEYYMSIPRGGQYNLGKQRLSLTKATLQDLEILIQLSSEIFEDNYDDAKSLIQNCLNSQTREQYLVTVDDKPMGIASVNHLAVEEASIFGLGILSEYRGNGYGQELLKLILKNLWNRGKQQVTLEVDSKNDRAFRLYQGMGFRIELAYDFYRKQVAEFC